MIQQKSILPIIRGRDVIAQAHSGTGKTATTSISILQSLDMKMRETQVLVLSPTRELATQSQKVILALGDYMNVQCHACIGGTSLDKDIKKLDYGQHVVSGTPGRVFGKFNLIIIMVYSPSNCAHNFHDFLFVCNNFFSYLILFC